MNRTDGLHLEADGLLQYDIYWRAEPAPARARTQPALIYTPHAHTPTPNASFGRTFYMLLARRKYFGCRPEEALDKLNDIIDAAPLEIFKDGLRVPNLSKQVSVMLTPQLNLEPNLEHKPNLNKQVLKGTKGGMPKAAGRAHYTASEAMRFTMARRRHYSLPCSPRRSLPRSSPCAPCGSLPRSPPFSVSILAMRPCRSLPRSSPCSRLFPALLPAPFPASLSCHPPCRSLPRSSPCAPAVPCLAPRRAPRVAPCLAPRRSLSRSSPCAPAVPCLALRRAPRVVPCFAPRRGPRRSLSRLCLAPRCSLPRTSPCAPLFPASRPTARVPRLPRVPRLVSRCYLPQALAPATQ